MLNCPFEKKYKAELEQARKDAAAWNLPGENFAATDVRHLEGKLHTLSVDHRLRGCVCQAAPAGTVF
jgi:hypothetical protein